MNATKEENRAFRGLAMISIGFLLTMMLQYLPTDAFVKMYVFVFGGFMLPCFGLIDISVSLKVWQKLDQFKQDNRAIGWQLAVFFATIPAAILAWFVSAWPVDMIYSAITGIYTFTGVQATAVNITKALVGLLVGLSVFLGIIWLWVNAHRGDAAP